MSLIYDSNKKIFIKQEHKKHSGKPACYIESPMEGFSVNHFVDVNIVNNNFFEFDTPSYYTLGGTLNYYNQDFYSVYTNVSRPFIRFVFTANTDHFGTGTTIKHQIYRIPYKEYKEYTAELERKNIQQNKNSSEETVEETITENGISKTTVTKRKVSLTNIAETLTPKSFPSEISGYEFNSTNSYDKIKNFLTTPILTITATTSGISTNVYDLFLGEYQKNKEDFSYQLFQDYAQYFITTQFEFKREQGDGLYEFCQLGKSGTIVPVEYQQYYQEITPKNTHIITGGTFSGFTVCGNYFTYFLNPNKPKWVRPYVTGQLTTFSPNFFWSNSNDADSYLLQVVYDSGDSQSFSGTVYSYPIAKEATKLSTEEMLGADVEDWATTQKTTDIVREYSVPLLRNKQFWFRIGGVKEMINIFGVKQSVVSFSDIGTAITTPGTYGTYIYTQSDSPHISDIPSWTYPTYLDDEIVGQYSLSGIVSGSVVTGATIQLLYPNGSYITQSTDITGGFVFTELEPGAYTLNTSYRGYHQDSRSVNVTGNTNIGIIYLKLVWGNKWDTWGVMSNKVFGKD